MFAHIVCCLQVLEHKTADTGGIKYATALVSGPGVFGQLRWESGVHRVTMVPANEKAGKMQTGTAVVIALPEASEVGGRVVMVLLCMNCA